MKPKQAHKVCKGLVMAIEANSMTVMTAQGEFLKTGFQPQATIGDEVTFEIETAPEPQREKSRLWQALPVGLSRAAAGLMVLMVATGASWAIPVGQVYLDVNPSLGLSYNIYERVIGVEGYNADGEVIKQALSIYGKSIEASVEATLTLMDEKGYVKEQDADVILGYSSDSEQVKAAAVKAVTAVVEKVEKPLAVAEVKVNSEDASQAKTDQTSPIKAALEKKAAQPVVDEKLNAVQKKLLEEQKRLEELKQKSELLNQKVAKVTANSGKLPPKAQKAVTAKQAVIQKQIDASQKAVTSLAQKAEALATIEEEETDLENAANFKSATAEERLALVNTAKEKLLTLRKKLLAGGVETEAEKRRLKQINTKIKQLEQMAERLNKQKTEDEGPKPKKEKKPKP